MANKVIVAGATGVVGNAVLERYVRDGWEVVALSRRTPECRAGSFTHVQLDLTDTQACAQAASAFVGASHLVYAALFEKPGLIAGWQEQDQMQTNLRMLQNLLTPLASTNALQHVTLLQGTKAYGAHIHAIDVPARENQPRDAHENFYWLQEDYLRQMATQQSWAWTILRPQIVFGYSYGTAMNLIPVLGIYAALLREQGEALHFPGGAHPIQEAVDADLLAQVVQWSASAATARNETFNVTNGDVCQWQSLWPELAAMFGMQPGEARPLSLGSWLPEQAQAWQSIVQRHALQAPELTDLLGESHHYADALFGYGQTLPATPALLSTIKLRRAGFAGCVDTVAMFERWFAEFRERRLLPALPQ